MAEARVLVVEDEGVISLHIQTMLRSMGYSVCGSASSGHEAIEKAGELRPDLILMDVRLREPLDGIEAARQIVARFNIPVVFVSGCADDETMERARGVGHFAYVSKPFSERGLDSAIKMTIQKYGLQEQRVTFGKPGT
ncbi:MAG: response regulator [Dehalococcoidia bacterium]|nr:response regulator [Dehalococcoidia bacterium]